MLKRPLAVFRIPILLVYAHIGYLTEMNALGQICTNQLCVVEPCVISMVLFESIKDILR